MKKKILIGVVVVLVLFGGAIAYVALTTRSHSPLEIVATKQDNLEVTVSYCRPYKKERLIFGEESADALVPYGKYWRLGANDATEITFTQDVSFAGESVSAGSYRMYAVPGADSWNISLNSELGEFGAFEPDYELDVVKVDVPSGSNPEEGGTIYHSVRTG